MRLATTLAAALLAVSLGTEAMAKRVALVIGNDSYDEVTDLQKAVSDSNSVADALLSVGFDVIHADNLNRREMNRQVQLFTSRLEAGDEAAFFFAGHGVEIEGRNYLLPTDIPAAQPGQDDFVRSEAIPVDEILDQIRSRGTRVSILMLDACRDNPFPKSGTRTVGSSRGLSRMEAPSGTFVIYSAGYGQGALDRLSDDDPHPNSVFTRNLVPLITTPDISLHEAARQVRRDVEKLAASVAHQQRPAYYDEVSGDFFFVKGDTAGPGKKIAKVTPGEELETAPVDAKPRETDPNEALFWESVKDTADAAELDAFLQAYPDGAFATLAKIRLARLNAGTAAPKPATSDPKPQAPASDAPVAANPESGPTLRDITRDIQTALLEKGCKLGLADGIWGRRSRQALQKLAGATDTSLPTEPGADLLAALKETDARCPATVVTTSSGSESTTTTRSSGGVCVRLSVRLPETKADGTPWDALGNRPDILIIENSQNKQTLCEDTFTCSLTIEAASAFNPQLTLIDKDVSVNDPIGSGTCRHMSSCKIGVATVTPSGC